MATILVIEDEVDLRKNLVDLLEFGKHTVLVAENGVEGVKVAQSTPIDLILSDIMMPELDGYGVFIELSQSPETSRIPFIFLTALSAKDDIRKGMALGADDYLTKPFTYKEVLQAVQTRLDRHAQNEKYSTQQLEHIRQYINLVFPHELRTPLTGISGYLHLLQEGLDGMDRLTIRKMLNYIQKSTDRLSNLIEKYVIYSQVQMIKNDDSIRAKLEMFSALKDLDMLVEMTAQREAYSASRIEDLEVDVEPAEVHIFHEHCTSLLATLINNAFKFSEKGTPVSVWGRKDNQNYLLTVTNYGRGMTEQQIKDIDANHQFDRDKYEQQGSGLGLIIAQTIAEIWGGEFRIESQPGKYLTVYVRLQRV